MALAGEIGEALRTDERLAGLGALFPIGRVDAMEQRRPTESSGDP
jgi:hypothetical protein